MGEEILQFYRKNINKEYKFAFVSTFVTSLLVHFYKFANMLPNHDAIYNYYSNQNILGSGRWALSLACGISSYYDLPWIIGLFSCVFIALTVVIIVALFKIQNPILIVIVGALLASSPATTETMFYLYTADGYMLAMFLSALAVYLSRIDEKRKSFYVLAGIFICVSCGIYQAFVSFALILSVCYFIDVLLQNKFNQKECVSWIFRQALMYTCALAAYYIIWKLCMHITGITANDYQGISEIGKNTSGLLISGLISSIKDAILYFLQWDVLTRGFTLYNILNIVFLFTMALGLIISCIKSDIFRRKWALGLLILCVLSIIPFAYIWNFISDSIGYRPMMLHSLTILFMLTALLYERWAKCILKNLVCCLLALIILNNALMANICYFYMNMSYERTYADGLEMMIEIHDFQADYEIDKVAILGDRVFDVRWDINDPNTNKIAPVRNIFILSRGLESNLLYDSDHTLSFLKATFGMDLESASTVEKNKLSKLDSVKAMGNWPARDSIAVIDKTLVIKLSDIEGEKN